MYKCYDCGLVFEEPKNYSEDRTPGGVFEGGSFIERYKGCPNCGGAFERAIECDDCGEFYLRHELMAADGGSYCQFCIDEDGEEYEG